jgi:hypothetical protein
LSGVLNTQRPGKIMETLLDKPFASTATDVWSPE